MNRITKVIFSLETNTFSFQKINEQNVNKKRTNCSVMSTNKENEKWLIF